MKDLYRSLRMLRHHERGIKPDDAWVKATRERLLMQVSNSMPTREAAEKNKRVLAKAYPNFFAVIRGPILATLSIVGVVFGGSFASVRAAERSLPGDTLYMVKLVTEQTRLALESSKTGKVKLKVEFTRRRAEELKTVAQTDTSDKSKRIAIAADLLKQDFHTLKEQLADAKQVVGDTQDSEEIRNVVEVVKAVDKDVVATVQVIKDTNTDDLSVDVKRKIVDAEAQAADAGVRILDILVTVTTNQNGADGLVTAKDIGDSVLAHSTVAQGAINEALQIASSTNASFVASVATPKAPTSTSSGVMAQAAAATLSEVQVLVQENKIVEAVDKLKEANTQSYLAQTEAQKESDIAIVTSSSSTSLTAQNASSTIEVVTNATTSTSIATSTTQNTTTTSP